MARILALLCVALCALSTFEYPLRPVNHNYKVKGWHPHHHHHPGMHGNRIPGHPRGPRAPAKLKATVVDIAKLVVGVFEGLGTKTNLNDITGCIEDTETIWSDVETAVSDFGTFDYDHIKAGIQELGKAVYLIPTDVKLCKAIPSDVAKLEDMAKIFLHPTQLVVEVAKAIWVNGVDILTELHKAVDDYNEAKYYDMGYQIGEAVA